jgi:hypothetical protein
VILGDCDKYLKFISGYKYYQQNANVGFEVLTAVVRNIFMQSIENYLTF